MRKKHERQTEGINTCGRSGHSYHGPADVAAMIGRKIDPDTDSFEDGITRLWQGLAVGALIGAAMNAAILALFFL